MMILRDDIPADEISETADRMVEQVTSVAQQGQPERVLDAVDELLELYEEFPDTVWDVLVQLTRSREVAVRLAVASRVVPHLFHEVNPYIGLKLAGWLREDTEPAVVEAVQLALPDERVRSSRVFGRLADIA